jgi:hypothetical protein
MSTNRLLLYCPCCTSKARIRDRLLSAREIVKQIEADAGGVFETIIPTMRSHREGSRKLRFYLNVEMEPAGLRDDVRAHVVRELRRIGNELFRSAGALETNGGVS